MKIYYFSWLKEKVGKDFEELNVPITVLTVSELMDYLSGLSLGYKQAFINPDFIRVAINHEHVDRSQAINNRDEVAFFPPITGG